MNNYFILLERIDILPYLVFIFLIIASITLPEFLVFEDGSSLNLKQVLIYGGSFFLVGWLVGNLRR